MSGRPPILRLHDELVIDNFAGGGGASLGIEWAIGRSPDIAVNHDPEAVAMHAANHPTTKHLCGDVWDVDPKAVCGGKRVALAWFSPDCTFHSKARGGKPFRDPPPVTACRRSSRARSSPRTSLGRRSWRHESRQGGSVKALSGRQPWWWAILHAGKRIENRTWSTHYRGPIFLHAAKGCTEVEYEDAILWMSLSHVLDQAIEVPKLADMPRGGIVGRARIVDVVPPCAGEGGRCQCRAALSFGRSWHMPEQFGFVLADVEPLPFVPWKGSLGLFDVPNDYVIRALPGGAP